MDWDAQIRGRLGELRSKLAGLAVGVGLWRVAGVLLSAALLASLVEMTWRLGSSARLLVICIGLLGIGILLTIHVIWPLLRRWLRPVSSEALALRWGKTLTDVNDRLLNALQIWERRAQDHTSPELAGLALQTVAQELEGASFQGVLDLAPLRRHRRICLTVGAIWMVMLLLTQGAIFSALGRVLQPGRDFGPPAPFALSIEDAPAFTLRGEPLPVRVQRKVHENMFAAPSPDIRLAVRQGEGEIVTLSAELDSSGSAVFQVNNPQDRLTLWAYAESVRSDTVRIEIKTRPFIKELTVRWFPPAYSKQSPGAAADQRGDVSALKGSQVRVHLEADRELSSAQLLLFNDAEADSPKTLNLAVQRREAQTEFPLLESGHYNILLADRDGIRSAAPVDYSLWPIQDEFPSVQIIYPPPEAELNESLLIPLKAQARDDFAISRMRLGNRIVKGGQTDSAATSSDYQWQPLDIEALGEGSYLVDHLWDLNNLNLLPGDEILYQLEARDNDAVSGPKTVLSPLQRLRFPTLEEIFARMDDRQGEQIQDAEETLDQSKAMKKELEALQEEMKRNPDLSWQERQKVEDLLHKQEEMAKQIEQMNQQAQQMIQTMEDNRLLSAETMQKYQELQQLMSAVMTPQLLQAMQKLQEALQKQDPQALEKAMEEFSINQEEFLAKLEKTLNILKQLQLEMKLDELAKRAEAALEQQQKINEEIDKSAESEKHLQEAAEEKDLGRDMEAFEREFKEIQEELKESPHNPEQTMQEAQSLLDQNQFPQTMDEMSQDLQEAQNQPAKQKGSKMQNGLAQLADQMRQAKDQMTNSAKDELADALKKIGQNLLKLSYQQEALLDTSSALDKASPRFRAQAQEQQGLKSFLEKTAEELFQLSQKSFFITPQIGAAVDQAFRGMEQALTGYTARSPQSVQHQQQAAMGGLNRAVMEISQSLNQLSSSSSSTGFDEMMEQLSKMAGQQGQINQGTMSLLPGGTNPGGLSMQQQAAMSRLAGEQQALQQQLEAWNQANQQTSQMMGRLSELGKEMQEIVNDLKNRQVDERTLKRQEQVLTRLLDAQRSVREREYKKERVSRTARPDILKPSPGEADQHLAPDALREQLLKALKEGYTRDYQELIRNYFEALGRVGK